MNAASAWPHALAFAGLYVAAGLPLKAWGVRRGRGGRPGFFFWLAPFYATDTWRQVVPVDRPGLRLLGRRSAVVFPLTAAAYGAYWYMLQDAALGGFGRALLAAGPFYLATEAAGLALQWIFCLGGAVLPAVQRQPLGAVSLADFWGRRWNRWVHGWLHQFFFRPFRRVRGAALLPFLVSGLWHEALFSLPFYLLKGEAFLGGMTAYFLLQAGGVWGEKRLLRGAPAAVRRVWLWLFVLAPAPLILNPALLRAFFL